MIQFNLLPDVKQQYIKAAKLKHTTVVVSLLVTASSLLVFVVLYSSVHAFQPARIKGINQSITDSTKTLKDTKDLDKILTIQNQLKSLPALHDGKPTASRLSGYLSQVTPTQLSIGELTLDFSEKTMKITGSSDSLLNVNKFIDTLKFTTYSSTNSDGSKGEDGKPFSSVVLGDFTRTEKDATYVITLVYNEAIFDGNKKIVLTVPKITTTRSETEKPTELFKALPEVKKL
jgi:voltage-gated potassium channel Kch